MVVIDVALEYNVILAIALPALLIFAYKTERLMSTVLKWH